MTFRGRLHARGRPSATVPVLMVDPDHLAAARQALADAEAGLGRAQLGPGELIERYEQAVTTARAEVAACYEHVTVTALPPGDMEDLVAAHPPAAGAPQGAVWNPDTFLPALLAACVSFGPDEPAWTVEDWAAETTAGGALSLGEFNALAQAALDVNSRAPDPHMGKG